MSGKAVVVCTWGLGRDGLPAGLEEALTLGRRVSQAGSGELRWLHLGPASQSAVQVSGRHGVARLDHIDDPKLEAMAPDAHVETLTQYLEQNPADVVFFYQSIDTRLVAARLAGRLGAAIVANGVDVEATEEAPLRVTASAFGGDTRVVHEIRHDHMCVVSLMANAIAPEPASSPTSPVTREIAVDLTGIEERIRVVQPAHTEGPRLEDAEVIVSGGRGLGSPENYKLIRELAQALGGLPGASRPLVDDGWVDSSQQVGLTGRITRPSLYVAAGISGASQHMAGCAAAKTIVAINSDPDAAIFRYARFGIVADCLEILPELIRAARAHGSQ